MSVRGFDCWRDFGWALLVVMLADVIVSAIVATQIACVG